MVASAVLRDCSAVHRQRRKMGIAGVSEPSRYHPSASAYFFCTKAIAPQTIRGRETLIWQIASSRTRSFPGALSRSAVARPDRVYAVEPMPDALQCGLLPEGSFRG